MSKEDRRQMTNSLSEERSQKDLIRDYGQITLSGNVYHQRIHLLNVIGEIEGHENLPGNAKSTKYEHILPQLAAVEDSTDIDGVLVLLNTVGGDVEAGLAIAEMIASLSKPKVCLVLGGGHSIGVPLAVAGDVTFIVPTATMVVHPLRVSGMVLGVRQNFEYIERMQERIVDFTVDHCSVQKEQLKSIMFNNTELAKDIGSMLVGRQAVEKGLIDRVGGISSALNCLYDLINSGKNSKITEYGYMDE